MGWYTTAEAARELKRTPKTVRNLVAKHKLARRWITVERSHRRAIVLPRATVERLRVLCWGEVQEPVKENRG